MFIGSLVYFGGIFVILLMIALAVLVVHLTEKLNARDKKFDQLENLFAVLEKWGYDQSQTIKDMECKMADMQDRYEHRLAEKEQCNKILRGTNKELSKEMNDRIALFDRYVLLRNDIVDLKEKIGYMERGEAALRKANLDLRSEIDKHAMANAELLRLNAEFREIADKNRTKVDELSERCSIISEQNEIAEKFLAAYRMKNGDLEKQIMDRQKVENQLKEQINNLAHLLKCRGEDNFRLREENEKVRSVLKDAVAHHTTWFQSIVSLENVIEGRRA